MPVPKTELDTLAIFPFAPFLKPHNPPLTDICESPLVCVSVNAKWASFIVGAMDALDQADLWIGTDEEKEDARQKVREIISMFSNQCIDEAAEIRKYYNDWRTYQTTLLGMYDGTPHSIDEDTPDTNFDSDSGDVSDDAGIRYLALCNAVRALVATSCTQWIIQKQQFASGLTLIVTLLSSALPFYGWIIGLLVTAALNWIASLDVNSLKDEEAQDIVACLIFDHLRNLEISQENFCSFPDPVYEAAPDGTNAQIIAYGFTVSDICNRGNYVAFLKALAENYRYAKAGIAEPCACDCQFVITFDLEDDSYEIVEGGRALLGGSDYVINGDAFTDGDQFGDRAEVTIPIEDCIVAGVSAVFRFDHGSANTLINLRCTLKLAGVIQDEINISESWPKNTWNTRLFEVFAETVDEIEIELAFQNTIDDDDKFVQLNTITINP